MSPKLDFESTDKVTGTDETSPKIHGVRVIVDTTNVKKSVGKYHTLTFISYIQIIVKF